MKLLDFDGTGPQFLTGRGPQDDRRHSEARAGREVVEMAEDGFRFQFEPDLFMRFAKSGFDDRFVAIESTPGQGELAGVISKARRAACEKETGFALLVGRDDQGDGGGPQIGSRHCLVFETREVGADAIAKLGIERIAFKAHRIGA